MIAELRQIPRGVLALGLVSLLMDLSSEMIHALLPVYLVTVLGTSALTVGIIEGIAEATASIVKIFSGALSDWLGRRKLLAVIGYGLAALTKPVFPLAPTVGWLVAARFIDRVGKGIRGAPRDALIADITPAGLRGAAFGLRQSLDTVGAFLGPLAAIALMAGTGDDFRVVFWVAVIPAFLAVGVIVTAVHEPARHVADTRPRPSLRDAGGLPGHFWVVVGIASLLTLARFSEAFLVLRARDAGLDLALVPAVIVVMSVVYALSAYPAGLLSDRIGRGGLLRVGAACLVLADVLLAIDGGLAWVMVGVAVWGLHMGLTQGLLSAMVADTAPAALRGTAFGVFNLAAGIAMLAASVLAGAIWDAYGPAWIFLAGAMLTVLALAGLLTMGRRTGYGGRNRD